MGLPRSISAFLRGKGCGICKKKPIGVTPCDKRHIIATMNCPRCHATGKYSVYEESSVINWKGSYEDKETEETCEVPAAHIPKPVRRTRRVPN